MSIRIIAVTPGSPADKAGIQPDERIISIGQEAIIDEIDYQALSVERNPVLLLENIKGEQREIRVLKNDWEPLGLCLDETEAMKPRHCCNHCLFCFVDQLPPGMRKTLYVKDDDWRLSMMMGNYVTLTNVDDHEFERILKRRASPLYISVHATDPEVRCRMLRNPRAGELMKQLKALKENGLEFHCQIVLCPGINDGAVLDQTLKDLVSLYPSARSLAIVPVGLTMHRRGLAELKTIDEEYAVKLIREIREFQDQCLDSIGTRFVYLSDEFYCISGMPLPEDCEYEDYSQIENGVGMLRLFEQECDLAAQDPAFQRRTETFVRRKLVIPTGVSARPFIQMMADRYAPPGTEVQAVGIPNRFFGETITVTGLIVGQDLIAGLQGYICDEILISATMLRENTDSFLDDISLEELSEKLNRPVRIVRNTGEAFIRALWGMEDLNG